MLTVAITDTMGKGRLGHAYFRTGKRLRCEEHLADLEARDRKKGGRVKFPLRDGRINVVHPLIKPKSRLGRGLAEQRGATETRAFARRWGAISAKL